MGYYNVRDLIGHFVKPASGAGKMCPHACCRNKRVHPENMPVILPSRLLRRASDDDLLAHYQRVQGDTAKDERGRAQVLHEMDRRDKELELKARRTETRKNNMYARRLEHEELVEHAYVRAEKETRGNLLNRKGEARGISPRALFTGSEDRARRYASEELLEHWQQHGRPTAAMLHGKDTRVYPKATERKRKAYGVRTRSGKQVQVSIHRKAA